MLLVARLVVPRLVHQDQRLQGGETAGRRETGGEGMHAHMVARAGRGGKRGESKKRVQLATHTKPHGGTALRQPVTHPDLASHPSATHPLLAWMEMSTCSTVEKSGDHDSPRPPCGGHSRHSMRVSWAQQLSTPVQDARHGRQCQRVRDACKSTPPRPVTPLQSQHLPAMCPAATGRPCPRRTCMAGCGRHKALAPLPAPNQPTNRSVITLSAAGGVTAAPSQQAALTSSG